MTTCGDSGLQQPTHIVFDFDGTLVDSAPGILESLKASLAACGVTPLCPLTPALIGPALPALLSGLTGIRTPAQLEAMTDAFKSHYDAHGYRMTQAYPGIPALLTELAEHGVELAIATNKRRAPTASLLDMLGWTEFFSVVVTPDAVTPAFKSKSEILQEALRRLDAPPGGVWYVGDRPEDAQAASTLGIPFARAAWGYGLDSATDWPDDGITLRNPTCLSFGQPINQRAPDGPRP